MTAKCDHCGCPIIGAEDVGQQTADTVVCTTCTAKSRWPSYESQWPDPDHVVQGEPDEPDEPTPLEDQTPEAEELRARMRDPNYTPTIGEALADPEGFVEGMTEEQSDADQHDHGDPVG